MENRPFASFTLSTLTVTVTFAIGNWKPNLQSELPLLGHRNWIAAADPGCPIQSASGSRAFCVEVDQLGGAKAVIAELARTRHGQPVFCTVAEPQFAAEK